MTDYFALSLSRREVDAISNLGLAHMGDGVYELLCRAYLCAQGDKTARRLHDDSVSLVKAPAQARFAQAILPLLTEEEADFLRRGKNTHTHAAPKSATAQEYALATGLETLFGALFLLGRTRRLNELFAAGMEAGHGL